MSYNPYTIDYIHRQNLTPTKIIVCNPFVPIWRSWIQLFTTSSFFYLSIFIELFVLHNHHKNQKRNIARFTNRVVSTRHLEFGVLNSLTTLFDLFKASLSSPFETISKGSRVIYNAITIYQASLRLSLIKCHIRFIILVSAVLLFFFLLRNKKIKELDFS